MAEEGADGNTFAACQSKWFDGGRKDDLKVTKLMDQDDIEAFLVTFERLMEAYEVPKACQAYKLAIHLTGLAQQAYTAMPCEVSRDYDKVKAAIL